MSPLLKRGKEADNVPVPDDIKARIQRAESQIQKDAALRDECWNFWRGNQYVHRNKDNYLVRQGTLLGEKPDHRPRTARNILIDIVRHEVSQATSRVPSYQVQPSTTDPEDVSAAQLAQQVALYGYGQWKVRAAMEELVTLAVVMDEGFVWPYFDNTIPPYISEDGIGVGDIRLRVYTANEVGWEQGTKFEESPFHVIKQARPIDKVQYDPDFVGGKLTSDGESRRALGDAQSSGHMVLVTEYLERPCPKYPNGRWLTIANDRIICAPKDYPYSDAKGEVVDEPVLHRLSYITDPNNDRDMGIIRHTLDAMRTANDCVNKQTLWKNLALNPQFVMVNMRLQKGEKRTDEPGKIYHAVGMGEMKVIPVPAIPQELQQMKDDAFQDIGRIASQNDIPNQVEAGKAIQALIERDNTARGSFIAKLAQFHADVMHHCLMLVGKHYTEPRLLKIAGDDGLDLLPDFVGSDLRSQVDVLVMADSIEPRTKQAMEERIRFYATAGWIDPHKAISAIESGMAESLLDEISADIRWQQHEIRQMKAMGRGEAGGDVPMARPFDNHQIHLETLHKWMKSMDFAMQPPEVQNAATLHEQQHQMLVAQQAQQQQMQQMAQAEQLGMANATRPTTKGIASQPSPS